LKRIFCVLKCENENSWKPQALEDFETTVICSRSTSAALGDLIQSMTRLLVVYFMRKNIMWV